jgi:ABC-type bacteriocin/lantibiotic exporter with double-glycine peptidase domain
MRTSGMAWLIAKTIAVCMSLVVMALPWAKPLINPLAEFATQNVVTNGVIHQTSPSTCGPCAMAFTLSLLGCTASEGVLADESFTSGSGTELWFLARCAERRGFRVTYSASTSVLSADSIIGIRLGDTGHSVSVYGVSDDYVAIHDSMQGRTMIPRTTLLTTYRYSGLSLHVAARPQPDR